MCEPCHVTALSSCGYKILRFSANPQKFQTLVHAKNSHLKVYTPIDDTDRATIDDSYDLLEEVVLTFKQKGMVVVLGGLG